MLLLVLLRILKQGRRAEVGWAATERSEEQLLCTEVNLIDEARLVVVCDIVATDELSALCGGTRKERHQIPSYRYAKPIAGVAERALA